VVLRLGSLAVAAASVAVLLAAAGCAMTGGTLGGRQTCWPESQKRVASLWRGTLGIDGSGARLDTPEGDVIPLAPGAVTFRVGGTGTGELVRGTEVIATAGDDVSLFGGAGSDGTLVVCDVEENRH
jgi:hypothetical protein